MCLHKCRLFDRNPKVVESLFIALLLFCSSNSSMQLFCEGIYVVMCIVMDWTLFVCWHVGNAGCCFHRHRRTVCIQRGYHTRSRVCSVKLTFVHRISVSTWSTKWVIPAVLSFVVQLPQFKNSFYNLLRVIRSLWCALSMPINVYSLSLANRLYVGTPPWVLAIVLTSGHSDTQGWA